MEKFFGWSNLDDMKRDFFPSYRDSVVPEDFPTEEEIIFAAYGGGGYDGVALVVYERDGKLFEVNGSHCSCYGLEDQWSPEETSKGALEMRVPYDKCITEALRLHYPVAKQEEV